MTIRGCQIQRLPYHFTRTSSPRDSHKNLPDQGHRAFCSPKIRAGRLIPKMDQRANQKAGCFSDRMRDEANVGRKRL